MAKGASSPSAMGSLVADFRDRGLHRRRALGFNYHDPAGWSAAEGMAERFRPGGARGPWFVERVNRAGARFDMGTSLNWLQQPGACMSASLAVLLA